MTFPVNTVVQSRHDVGIVRRALASGWAYKVEFPGLGEVTCLANVLTEAPGNVTVFRRKGEQPEPPRAA